MLIEVLTHNRVLEREKRGVNEAWVFTHNIRRFRITNFSANRYTILTHVMISLVFNWLFYSAFSQNMQEKNLNSNIK